MESTAAVNEANTANKKRKRPRAIQACDRCREKKYKCNESYPCFHCKKSGLRCHYDRQIRPREDESNGSYVSVLEHQVEELTAQLRQQVGRNPTSQPDERQGEQPAGYHGSQPAVSSPIPGLVDSATPGGFRIPEDGINDADSPCDSEITDVNRHTNGIEFHGSSSSVAFLGNLQKLRTPQPARPSEQNTSLVSDLHNARFPTQSEHAHAPSPTPPDERFYFKRAHLFIDGYFSGVHFIHPFIDKEDFMSRASELWFGNSARPPTSFIALYLSILSIGALMRTWEEGRLDGLTRFEWSRKLFSEALAYSSELQYSNDLDTVHYLYLLAKVCQNELNPHMAYIHLGQAIRTCLSAGFNRELPNPKTQRSEVLSRTWWGLFSFEIEMSFTLGRPDTLGIDRYHNRRIPDIDDSEYAIIPCMVTFSQIIRQVSVEIYHSRPPIIHNMPAAFRIQRELDDWVCKLPARIRPAAHGERSKPLSALREPSWCRRQRLVLELRYHNVKMLLFRPFLSHHLRSQVPASDDLRSAADKCISSAQTTIEVIYDFYNTHTYFRTWWYNTSYVMVAASVLLLFLIRSKTESANSVLKYLELAIEILEAMDESVVAKKSAEIVRRFVAEATRGAPAPRATPTGSLAGQTSSTSAPSTACPLNFLEFPGLDDVPSLDFLDNSFGDVAAMFEGINDIPGLSQF